MYFLNVVLLQKASVSIKVTIQLGDALVKLQYTVNGNIHV